MTDDTNTCVICLESLTGAPMGVSVPCGHPFHEHCFRDWEASRRRHSSIKCPMCNNESRQFCRIYIDLEAVMTLDDVSISSTEESRAEDNDPTLTTEKCSDSTDGGNSSVDDAENERQSTGNSSKELNFNGTSENQNIIVIDDETPALVSKSQNTAVSKDEADRYRNKAKQLKRRLNILQSQRDIITKEKSMLSKENEEIKAEHVRIDAQLNELIRENESFLRTLEGLQLRSVILTRERDQARNQLSQMEERLNSAQESIKIAEDQHKKALEKMNVNSLSEVKDILQSHPKLLEEKRSLNEELKRKNAEINNLKRMLRHQSEARTYPVDSEGKENFHHRESSSIHQAKVTAKAFRALHEKEEQNRERTDQARSKKEEQREILQRISMKASGHAMRMHQQAKAHTRMIKPLDALDSLEREPKRTAQPAKLPISTWSHFSEKDEKRKRSLVSAALTEDKTKQQKISQSLASRSLSNVRKTIHGQGDIRAMFKF